MVDYSDEDWNDVNDDSYRVEDEPRYKKHRSILKETSWLWNSTIFWLTVSAPKMSKMDRAHCTALATAMMIKRHRKAGKFVCYCIQKGANSLLVRSGWREGSDISRSSWGCSAYAAVKIKHIKARTLWTIPIMMVPCLRLNPQQFVISGAMVPCNDKS